MNYAPLILTCYKYYDIGFEYGNAIFYCLRYSYIDIVMSLIISL